MNDAAEQHPAIFAAFLAAYPDRPEGTDAGRTRAAWARAISAGADPLDLLSAAIAYRQKMQGRESRYVLTPSRWLTEGRWRDTASKSGSSSPPLVWIDAGSQEWRAWTAYRGKSPPIDRRGGWSFPSQWPPEMQAAE